MKDIKFRGKRKDNGEWVYGYYARHCVRDDGSFVDVIVEFESLIIFEIEPEPIDQFTGLKDKNDVEDYVGNIWEVEYLGKMHRFLRTVICGWTGYEYEFECITGPVSPVHARIDEDGIIIGNIHENPELMAKAESNG